MREALDAFDVSKVVTKWNKALRGEVFGQINASKRAEEVCLLRLTRSMLIVMHGVTPCERGLEVRRKLFPSGN
ncbi:MAG: hypothetical protein ACEY26_01045 [Candidatus Hodgkinia cicadicola]